MSDIEFDVLDELYFVQPFAYLVDELEIDEFELRDVLSKLIDKGWVKCFVSMQEEELSHQVKLEEKFKEYFYLATKAGLMAHNGR